MKSYIYIVQFWKNYSHEVYALYTKQEQRIWTLIIFFLLNDMGSAEQKWQVQANLAIVVQNTHTSDAQSIYTNAEKTH